MIQRRLKTIPTVIVLLLVVTLLSPALLVVTALVDLTRKAISRKPMMATRLLAFAWVYLAAQAGVIVVAGAQWIASLPFGTRAASKRSDWSYWLQSRWVNNILAAMKGLFGLTFEVENQEAVGPGPVIVLFRHVSIMDNLLPHAFVAAPAGLRLRWVLKKELLRDPALDIGGNRMPNYFVDRDSDDPETERANVRNLGADMGPGDGVLLFPEGTRFSRARRKRFMERLAQSSPELHQVMAPYEHVLPPRTGGVLALLDHDADVILGAHAGFEDLRGIREIWSKAPVGRTIRLSFRRISQADIPVGVADRKRWLFHAWAWVGAEVEMMHRPD